MSSDKIKEDYVISTINGEIFYGAKWDLEAWEEDDTSSYLISKIELREFLRKAAQEIDTIDKFEYDPIQKFPVRYKLYYLCLLVMFFNLIFSILDFSKYVTFDQDVIK